MTTPLRLPPGVHVRYVDRQTREELIQSEGANLAAVCLDASLIPGIDVVDDADRLATFADDAVDFVIANHVLEHLEDPIAALGQMLRVVRPGGIVFLTLPDARHWFDARRERTSVEHPRARPRARTAAIQGTALRRVGSDHRRCPRGPRQRTSRRVRCGRRASPLPRLGSSRDSCISFWPRDCRARSSTPRRISRSSPSSFAGLERRSTRRAAAASGPPGASRTHPARERGRGCADHARATRASSPLIRDRVVHQAEIRRDPSSDPRLPMKRPAGAGLLDSGCSGASIRRC